MGVFKVNILKVEAVLDLSKPPRAYGAEIVARRIEHPLRPILGAGTFRGGTKQKAAAEEQSAI